MKAEYKDDMFIVINRKHIDELQKHDKLWPVQHALISLKLGIDMFNSMCDQLLGKDLKEYKYYVCNQDEPYADQVLKIILDGESKKCTS